MGRRRNAKEAAFFDEYQDNITQLVVDIRPSKIYHTKCYRGMGMLGVLKLFDAYTIRARIFPSLIAGLPVLALPFMIVPWDRIGLSNIVVTIMSIVLFYALADFAQWNGRRIERKLGTRSTPYLWYRSNKELPESSKELYRNFISTKIKRSVPSVEDETNNPELADDFYAGAGNWLRDETRDTKKFVILFDKLVSYGFRRNLLGLRTLSIVLNLIIGAIAGSILYFMPSYFQRISDIQEKLSIVVLVVVVHSIYMLLAVREGPLREASEAYGKQLILSCGTLMKHSRAARANKGEA